MTAPKPEFLIPGTDAPLGISRADATARMVSRIRARVDLAEAIERIASDPYKPPEFAARRCFEVCLSAFDPRPEQGSEWRAVLWSDVLAAFAQPTTP